MSTTAGLWEPRLVAPSAQALYLHIPFCISKCRYCDFPSSPTRRHDPIMDAYVEGLKLQLDQVRRAGVLEGCRTAYVGGGTPTLLGDKLPGLVEAVSSSATPSELSFEANPDSLTPQLATDTRAAGATRVSIGVQSLNDDELTALGRVHDAACARAAVAGALDAGLDVSIDLMCAIPRQTEASWQATLAEATNLGICHLSAYPLIVEEGTALFDACDSGREPWPDDDVEADRMLAAERVATGRGFARYEVASYAKPGHACAHNVAYWTAAPYLGLGAFASSMLTREGVEVLRQVCPQLPQLDPDTTRVRLRCTSTAHDIARDPSLQAASFEVEQLTQAQAAAEDLMLGCRMTCGTQPGLLDHARDAIGAGRVDACVQTMVEEGLCTLEGGRLVPTGRGWLLGNALYGALWDLSEGTILRSVCSGLA